MRLKIFFSFASILTFVRSASTPSEPSSAAKHFPKPSIEDVNKANKLLADVRSPLLIPDLGVSLLLEAMKGKTHKLVASILELLGNRLEKIDTVITAMQYPTCAPKLLDNLTIVADHLPATHAAVVMCHVLMNLPWKEANERIKNADVFHEKVIFLAVSWLIFRSIIRGKFGLAKYALDMKAIRTDRLQMIYVTDFLSANLLGRSPITSKMTELFDTFASTDKKGRVTVALLMSVRDAAIEIRKNRKYFDLYVNDILKHPLIDQGLFKALVAHSIDWKFYPLMRNLIDSAYDHELIALKSTLDFNQQYKLFQIFSQGGDLQRTWERIHSLPSRDKDRCATWFKQHATPIFQIIESLNILPLLSVQFISEYAATQQVGTVKIGDDNSK